MDRVARRFLQQLLATPTPTGSEEAGQDIVTRYLRAYADTVERDVHGNVHAVLNPQGAYRVMLAGHCDEIGLMVQHIDEKGFLYVSMLGGIHVPLLQGERIVIQGRRGPVHGVIGVKPIHLMKEKEEKEPSKIHELWVDIGARSRKDAERVVAVGNVATVNSGWLDLQNGRIACRGLDDRLGAFVIADVLRVLKGKRLAVAVHAVSTVQEEVGLRGAKTAAFGVDPKIGLAVDVGFASDYPGVDPKIVGEAKLGGGPILHCGPTYNKALLERLQRAARNARIRTQFQPEPRGAGTDAYAMMLTRAGVAVGLVSVPTRYLHSAVETAALQDATNAVRLIAQCILELRGDEQW